MCNNPAVLVWKSKLRWDRKVLLELWHVKRSNCSVNSHCSPHPNSPNPTCMPMTANKQQKREETEQKMAGLSLLSTTWPCTTWNRSSCQSPWRWWFFLAFLPLQSFSCQIEPSLPFLVLRGHQGGEEWTLPHPASNNKMWSRVVLRWSFFTSGCSGGTLMAGHTLWIKIKLVSQSGNVKAEQLKGSRSTLTFLSVSCCQNAEEQRQFSKIYIAPVNPCWVDESHQ